MASVLIRTVLIYLLLVGMIRLTGKRQIGELQLSELITTLLLSEMASYPLTNANIPLLFCIVPIIMIICLEILLSFLSTKSARFKRLLSGKPGIIIRRGKLDQKEMSRMRLSMEDLLCALRLKDIASPDEVEYAILEQNGQISVLPKSANRPAVRADLSLPAKEDGLAHAVVIDGHIIDYAVENAGKSDLWIQDQLSRRHLDIRSVFLMTVDDGGAVKIIRKEG